MNVSPDPIFGCSCQVNEHEFFTLKPQKLRALIRDRLSATRAQPDRDGFKKYSGYDVLEIAK